MKKLIYILFLFISSESFGQIEISETGFGYQTAGVGSLNSISHVPDDLFICITGTTNSGGTPATVSLSGTGQTWTEINSLLNGSQRIQAFRWLSTTTAITSIGVTYTGTQDGGWILLYRVRGGVITGTNGADAIVQSVTNSGTSTDPNIAMASMTGRNAVLSIFMNNANPFGGAPESGWTEYEDSGYNTPSTGGYVMYRLQTNDNTPTVTAASSTWTGIAIEIKAQGRRIISSN